MRQFFAIALALFCCSAVNADLIMLTDSSSKGFSTGGGAGFGNALLNSTTTTSSINANGSVSLFGVTGASGAFANSIYDVTFTVDKNSTFNLTTSLGSFASPGTAFSTLSLVGTGVNISLTDPQSNFSTGGLLSAGSIYHLIAHTRVDQAATSATGAGVFQTSLSAIAVPEPSSMILLGTAASFGLGAVARRRLKKKQAASAPELS